MFKFILFLSFLTFSAIASFAQGSAVCDVQLKVYSIENIRDENPVQLEGVKIVVKNSAGKTVKPSKDAANLYAKLPEGDYEVAAMLAGYKTSVDKFSPLCPEEIVPPVAVSRYVFMWKGDPKEKVNRNSTARGVFQVSGKEPTGVSIVTGVSDVIGIRPGESSNSPIINGKAVKLAKPVYPSTARAVRASGAVNVQVTIDELGYVISAAVVSGHPLLQSAAVKAARESKFRTTTLEGFPVKVTGIIVYNFTAQ